MAAKQKNPNSTPGPAPKIDWAQVRQQHGRENQAAIEKCERTLDQLDRSCPEEKAGRGR